MRMFVLPNGTRSICSHGESPKHDVPPMVYEFVWDIMHERHRKSSRICYNGETQLESQQRCVILVSGLCGGMPGSFHTIVLLFKFFADTVIFTAGCSVTENGTCIHQCPRMWQAMCCYRCAKCITWYYFCICSSLGFADTRNFTTTRLHSPAHGHRGKICNNEENTSLTVGISTPGANGTNRRLVGSMAYDQFPFPVRVAKSLCHVHRSKAITSYLAHKQLNPHSYVMHFKQRRPPNLAVASSLWQYNYNF